MSANVAGDGTVTQLDGALEPDENITEESVKEPRFLARFLLRLFREVTALKRLWLPRRIDFQGIVSTGTSAAPQTVRLDHGLACPVVYWIVKAQTPGAVTLPLISETTETSENTLVVKVYFPATLTIRVEEAGA